MLHKIRSFLNIRKLQFFVVIAGLLIASSVLYHFNLGNQSSTTSQHGVLADSTGVATPGLVLIWGANNEDSTVSSDSWLHAGQIVFNWNQVEQTEGSFSWTENGNSLNKELQLYAEAGKTATIQVNGDSLPTWLVNSSSGDTAPGNGLVPNCGYFGLTYTATTVLIPEYWSTTASDGMNPVFESAMQSMLDSLATAINNSPYKSAVLGIRTGYDLVGTEHYSLGENNMHVNATAPAACNGWTSTIGDKAAGKVMYMNYEAFEPIGIHPLLRTEVIPDSGPGQYFYQDGGFTSATDFLSPSKAWIFQTDADPDDGGNTNPIWVQYIKTGETIGYAEQLLAAGGQNGVVVHDALSWEWWRELMDLSRGTSYIATYYADLTNPTLADNFFNQTFFQNFANSFAGTNNTKDEASSPGAWVAFAPSSSPFGGNLDLFMTQTASSNTQGYDSNKGANILGSGQPYGRYATEINPGGSITLTLDSAVQTGGSATVNVWYYDTGSGDWSVSGGSVNQTVTKASCTSDCWKMISFDSSSIPRTITLNVPAGASTGTYFHLVEILKGGSAATCTSNPTVSLTAPTSGATVSGSNVALSANASAASHCTLANVVFSVGSTSIATVNNAPYSTNWDSTSVSNGSYTITATATDTSGHSASSDVAVTVDNNPNTNPGGPSPGGPGPGSGPAPITVGNGGTVPVTPNTTTEVNGTVTLAPAITSTGSPDYVIKTVYYLNGKLLATETKAPYSYHLNTTNYLNGTYILTVRTYFASGAITVSSQKLVINNPLSFKEVGLLLMHCAIPITVIVVAILGVAGFLFWWVRFHSPGGRVALTLNNVRTSLSSFVSGAKRFFTNFPPWNRPSGGSLSPNGTGQDGGSTDSQLPSSSSQLDKIPNPTAPIPGEVVGPENPTNTEK